MNDTATQCVPCESGASPASEAEIAEALARLSGWTRSDDGAAIEREWRFKTFKQAHAFVNKVSQIAEAENHHPDISFGWGYARLRLMTHAIGGLHKNDFIVAAKVNAL